nr:MAG TPA: hypothetical protein [Caudoviricetes sp.]
MVLLRPIFVLHVSIFSPCNKPLLQTVYFTTVLTVKTLQKNHTVTKFLCKIESLLSH